MVVGRKGKGRGGLPGGSGGEREEAGGGKAGQVQVVGWWQWRPYAGVQRRAAGKRASKAMLQARKQSAKQRQAQAHAGRQQSEASWILPPPPPVFCGRSLPSACHAMKREPLPHYFDG